MKKILTTICAIGLLTACQKDEETQQPVTPAMADRTVIVYMSAENNLSPYSLDDLSEMKIGAKEVSSNNNLVYFMDRSSTIEKPYIARIRSNMQVDTLYKYQEDFYNSDPERFAEVLSRVTALCPARSYGLVLWGHANGWCIEGDTVAVSTANAPRRAYGRDRGDDSTTDNNTGKWLNIPSMRMALESLGIKWKFIFCDCCNMMGAEVAYELRNVADYLIGSPAEIPGNGAPYDKMAPHFFMQTDNFYEEIVNDYAEAYPNKLPLSAIQLDKMDTLASVTRQMMPYITEYLQQAEQQSAPLQDIIYYYSPSGRSNNTNKNMYDMKNVMRAAVDNHAGDAASEDYAAWETVFNQAVKIRKTSETWETNNYNTVRFSDFSANFKAENQGCVSMFFPLSKYQDAKLKPNESIRQMAWFYAVGWPEAGW